MTTDSTDLRDAGTTRGGTVFDIGYQTYSGPREGRRRARLAVYKDGVRTALGLGRGARAKILPWAFIALLAGIGLILAMVAGAAVLLDRPGGAEGLPSHSDYYGFASSILFVFAAVVAPELLCRDRRDGVINLYLVRPLTGSDYILARWAAFLTVMVAAAWFPQFILLIGRSMGDPTPVAYLRDNWSDIPRFLAAGFVIAAYTTTLALLTASFTTRRAYASVFLVGLFVITTPFTLGLAAEVEGAAGQWILMFNLISIPMNVNDLIFNDVNLLTAELREEFDGLSYVIPPSAVVGWYLAWTLVPAAALWLRYRRLTP